MGNKCYKLDLKTALKKKKVQILAINSTTEVTGAIAQVEVKSFWKGCRVLWLNI